MRTLAITQNVTLDGCIEMIGDWFDPSGETGQGTGDGRDQLAEMHRQDERCDAVLLGRRTFTDFRGYWPQQSDDTTGVTDYLNRVDKYVLSSTLTDPEWQHSTILRSLDEVRALRAAPGRDIVCTGSITLTHALLEAGLVDELRLFTYPVVQGRGRRLFPDGLEIAQPSLRGSTAFDNGVVLTTYAVG